ncbi:succinate dehydrogenase, hydrophobic membrane anchor protein [Sphingomonas desiccabilis]|uniref:Succinate dehydrogenase hydrophobic membrane anchor subunit n=1 Tax=Sphingomonas desiccabilis TaxID=429134 RepID=A0A4Q2ISQ1_9SPHN|nr:succinate dehydrogenase, hydrophobic membrane anchor protein [Sphingomonas desiccabilis]MBB3911929.1 succinate dehydrogenase / fumarate reductase membrane anchor subunit [Sphingomonas desiccabilis]RXZ31368.1 succinate dehydrogenase, hydrophobic membrane anchor protein [Sphingomonas desiccabilis]
MGNGTSIGRVRGLGSGKHGTHHWWHQRLTAGSNLLLLLWFLFSIAMLPSYDGASLTKWLSSGWAALPMALLIATLFYHARLGLQVVIEDYQQDETRVVLLVVLNLLTALGAGLAIFSILRIAFTGTPA